MRRISATLCRHLAKEIKIRLGFRQGVGLAGCNEEGARKDGYSSALEVLALPALIRAFQHGRFTGLAVLRKRAAGTIRVNEPSM